MGWAQNRPRTANPAPHKASIPTKAINALAGRRGSALANGIQITAGVGAAAAVAGEHARRGRGARRHNGGGA